VCILGNLLSGTQAVSIKNEVQADSAAHSRGDVLDMLKGEIIG